MSLKTRDRDTMASFATCIRMSAQATHPRRTCESLSTVSFTSGPISFVWAHQAARGIRTRTLFSGSDTIFEQFSAINVLFFCNYSTITTTPTDGTHLLLSRSELLEELRFWRLLNVPHCLSVSTSRREVRGVPGVASATSPPASALISRSKMIRSRPTVTAVAHSASSLCRLPILPAAGSRHRLQQPSPRSASWPAAPISAPCISGQNWNHLPPPPAAPQHRPPFPLPSFLHPRSTSRRVL